MQTKKLIKNMGSVGMGILAVGATIAGALAYDLSDYPQMFIEEGEFNGILVVGSEAKAEDIIGITNIATSLQAASVTNKETIVNEDLTISEGYELCNRSLYLGTNIADCEPSVDDSDLDLLADGVYHDSEGENDNDEKYTQQLLFGDANTGEFLFTQDDQDAPFVGNYLFLDNSQHYLYNFKLQFDSGVEVSDENNEEAGDDLEGTSLIIQDKTFVITDVKIDGSTIEQIEMQSSDGSIWMSEGEAVTRTIDGVEHTIELMDVSADATEDSGSCGFKVDATELWVDVKDTETVNGVAVGVVDAKRVNLEAQNQDVCEVAIGSQELTIINGDEIKFNNEDVDGTYAEITTASSSGGIRWTGFEINWASNSNEIYLEEGDEFIDPIFGNFKIIFAGVETGGSEIISFDASSNSVDVFFKNEDGEEVNIPLASSASSQAGEAVDEPVYWGNEAPISSDANSDELIYLEGETCTGVTSLVDCQGAMFLVVEPTKDEAHIVEITNIDTNDNEISFDDLTYETTDDDVAYTDGISSGIALKSAGNVFLTIDETNNTVNFDSIGSSHGTKIKTENRAELEIVNTDLLSQTFEGLIFSEFDDGSLSASDYLLGMEVDIVYDDDIDNQAEITSNSVSALTSSVGFGFYDVSDDEDDDQVFSTKKGTLITYDNKDNSYLMIEHPYDAAYAQVYISPTEAGVSMDIVTETIVNPISVGAVKLDFEIKLIDNQNIIAVGGACANSVVAELMGNPKNCATSTGMQSGQALIKLFENGDYVALVVAGQDAMDTRLASQIVANWDDYDLSGSEMIATTVSESSLSVEKVE